MFVITDSAAQQFRASAKAIDDQHLSLRISAKKNADGEVVYNMGFDTLKDDDIKFSINDLEVIVDPESSLNVVAMVIDFREFDGQQQFVFLNPSDEENDNELNSNDKPG